MCIGMKAPRIQSSAARVAAVDNGQANRQADIEARLRRLRSSAASSILTSPVGIPAGQSSTSTLGGVSQ